MPHPGSMAYNMAKAAVDQMIRTAATELTAERIRVNGIHPGWIDTPGERKFLSEAALKRHAAELPWGRLGQSAEIARAILFLLSDDADYMTGKFLEGRRRNHPADVGQELVDRQYKLTQVNRPEFWVPLLTCSAVR